MKHDDASLLLVTTMVPLLRTNGASQADDGQAFSTVLANFRNFPELVAAAAKFNRRHHLLKQSKPGKLHGIIPPPAGSEELLMGLSGGHVVEHSTFDTAIQT